MSGVRAALDVAAAFKADGQSRHPVDDRARLLPGEALHAQFDDLPESDGCVVSLSVMLGSNALTICSWVAFIDIFRTDWVAVILIGVTFIAQVAISLFSLSVGSWLLVTDQRLVLGTNGFFRRTRREVPLESVRAVAFVSNQKTEMSGRGSLLVDTGDDHPPLRVPGFPVASLNKDAVPIRPAGRRAGPVLAAAHGLSGIVIAVAALIAPGSRAEWMAEQASAERLLPAAARLRFDCGLVKAAVIMRLSRISAPLVKRVNAVACSERNTRKAACLTVGASAVYIFFHAGLAGVISDAEGLAVIGTSVYALARWRRETLKSRDQ